MKLQAILVKHKSSMYKQEEAGVFMKLFIARTTDKPGDLMKRAKTFGEKEKKNKPEISGRDVVYQEFLDNHVVF